MYSFKYLIIIKITISHSKVKTLTRIEETQLTYSLHDFILFSASKQKLSSAKENQKRERESDLPSAVSEWNSNAIWDLSVWFVHGDPRRRWWLGVREASDLRYDSNLTGRVKCLCAVGSARWSRSHGTQRKSLNLSQSLRAESQKRKWNSKFQRERVCVCWDWEREGIWSFGFVLMIFFIYLCLRSSRWRNFGVSKFGSSGAPYLSRSF